MWDRMSEENTVRGYNLWVVILEEIIETKSFDNSSQEWFMWAVDEFCR